MFNGTDGSELRCNVRLATGAAAYLQEVLQAALALQVVDVVAVAGHRLVRVVVCGGQAQLNPVR